MSALPIGMTIITALCVGGVVVIAIVMMAFGGNSSSEHALDDVYERRGAAQSPDSTTATERTEPVSFTKQDRGRTATSGAAGTAAQRTGPGQPDGEAA